MRRTTRFRQLVEQPEILAMPGVHDALSARIAAEAGFPAVVMGGFAATASLLGEPDTSQLSLSELADHYARLCDAVDIPVFADADTGFGNVTNVARTIRLLERAGVGGLFIEDQVFPKRCGHTAGKAVIPAEEMVAKIKAAVDSRQDADLVLMARTDALAVEGIDQAIERINLYREAGADLLFVEAPRDRNDMRRILDEAPGHHLANMVEFGLTPEMTAAELEEIGFAVAIWPVSSVLAVTKTLRALFADLRQAGTTRHLHDRLVGFKDFTDLVGLPRVRQREQDCLDAARALVSEGK
ncbi:oxaloacetate decarboxylase [Telmatospirillum sp. J64-1]|uniref:isocitrate lyase/PEP mutase family protein n=1 Tax=Telmatospirillum sp. J64-1 TaxID=2502183 RepID=UPI00115F6580|nr:oxaloacetate decarboxylase [Telmatospirillum sp. J64-1]